MHNNLTNNCHNQHFSTNEWRQFAIYTQVIAMSSCRKEVSQNKACYGFESTTASVTPQMLWASYLSANFNVFSILFYLRVFVHFSCVFVKFWKAFYVFSWCVFVKQPKQAICGSVVRDTDSNESGNCSTRLAHRPLTDEFLRLKVSK